MTSNNNSPKDDSVYLNMVTVPAIKGQMANQFKALVHTVEKITGYNITLVESKTYQDAIEELKSGRAQLAWLGAKAYLESAHAADVEAFAVGIRGKDQRTTYRTFFLARIDSNIKSIHDMKGKCLVLSERGSTSGDLMPRYELTKYGLNPEMSLNFSNVIYSGSQESSVTSVLSGTGDVAAISEINYETLLIFSLFSC